MIKLFKYLKPYSLNIAGVVLFLFLQAISQLYLPTLMSDIVDIGIVNGDTAFIMKVGGLMFLVALGGAVCIILSSLLSSKTATGFGKIIRSTVFNKVENFSLYEFNNTGTASLINRTTNDITQVQMVTLMMLRMMIMAPMMCIGGIVMAVLKDARLAVTLIFAVPVLGTAIFIIASKGMPLFKLMQKKLDRLNLVTRERLTGIRVIRAFNRTIHEHNRFKISNKDLTDTSIRVYRLMASLMPVMMIVLNFTIITVVWFGGIRIDNGSMQVGDLMAFIQYVMHILFSLMMISMIFVMIPRASVSASRINEVLDIEPGINNPQKPAKTEEKHGFIEFRDVEFSYPGAEEPVLSNISFSAGPGEVTAIIGGTGSGKSTLVNLIPRFYDINKGSILIDGLDIREMTREDLRSKIGFVPQKAVLFTGTVADNIRYGKENAADEEIKNAARTAQADDFIEAMENGYESVISQGGTNLSGGQKQRLAIARALVRNPEIFIFDDSFSAVDFKTDARLRAALKTETESSAVIIVAQRVSTVMNADRIIVLDNGKIAGAGRHKELLDTCEVYREIVSSQLSEEELQ